MSKEIGWLLTMLSVLNCVRDKGGKNALTHTKGT